MCANQSDDDSYDENEEQQPRISTLATNRRRTIDIQIDPDVLSTLNMYTCVICMNIARDPLVGFCGHMFCGLCIMNWMDTKGSRSKCPYCLSCVSKHTMIAVKRASMPCFRSCQPIGSHRDDSMIANFIAPPADSMYLGAICERPPQLMPRLKPLAPELLVEHTNAPTVMYLLNPSLWQRAMVLVIIFYLYMVNLHSSHSS
ncbi:uncharacterized protein LOC117573682 [Drosophila albomicans]|uniref:RING-type E3 ubiquitin transferase n=1 Tax=Drosophila albomicans TaxID=7291 RepID=A0A6P8XJ18_DROAB|nr:uncharacterized protein LOC117573682 [Drosophila albomicans]